MGRKTSVYLADDILAALAEVIRAGLTGTSLTARAWHGLDDSDARTWPLRPGDRLVFGGWQLEVLPGIVGRGRTMAVVEQLRAHGGEIILAEPGQPDPAPDLGPRTIKLGGEDA